jgi:hypothetical protein
MISSRLLSGESLPMDSDTEKLERRISRLMMSVETQIMMCDDANDLVLLATGMLRKAIFLLDNQYQSEARKALVESFNQ